jgi:ParB family transcriptional regulator, chromosome partitioning protein
MSTRSKLLQMTEGLELPPAVQAASPPRATTTPAMPGIGSGMPLPPAAPGLSPRTGPGQMLEVRTKILGLENELAKANERVQGLEAVPQTKKLDPALVIPTGWANRHADAFKNAEFERLKADIQLSGGNVQAISVRPLAAELGKFEIVFGHRRHRACLELGLPVLATVETAPISDLELFAAMDRENRERADLSPFEQGTMYRRALDAGLYPSNRRMAEALGVSHTWVANVLAVADLPAPVLECFRTPLEVQHRHAKALSEALERDRKTVLRRVEKLRQATAKLAPGAVVSTLLSGEVPVTKSAPQPLKVGNKLVGSWSRDPVGRVTIQLSAAAVPDEKLERILASISQALESDS